MTVHEKAELIIKDIKSDGFKMPLITICVAAKRRNGD
mgnify:CR=1 FL=1